MVTTMGKTLLIGVTGGSVFLLLRLPLPWVLGPLLAVLVSHSIFKQEVCWPNWLRNVGLVVLGCKMGSSFSADAWEMVSTQFSAMLGVTVGLVVFCIGFAYFTHRRTGISLSSSMLGSMPGGFTQMVVLSEEIENADMAVVSFFQTMRLLLVLLAVPFIVVNEIAGQTRAGVGPLWSSDFSMSTIGSFGVPLLAALIGIGIMRAMRIPMPYMLGPAVMIAFLEVHGTVIPPIPGICLLLAQLVIGIHLGSRIRLDQLQNWRSLLPYAVGGAFGTVVVAFGTGYFLHYIYYMQLPTAFLGTAPGGLAEMCMAAVAINADIATVTVYQMFRLFFIMLVMTPLLKVICKRINRWETARER